MDCSFSALDSYFSLPAAPVRFVHSKKGVAELAAEYENLSFAGLAYADALDDSGSPRLRFRCQDGDALFSFKHAKLAYDSSSGVFYAEGGDCDFLKDPEPRPSRVEPELTVFEAAILASRYPYKPSIGPKPPLPGDVPATQQRDLLELILTGSTPDRGLDILRNSGFIDEFWPELGDLSAVSQSKDFHPEGDVWRHTLETFSYRKSPDLVLSLALLFHDAGKPDSVAHEGRRFDRHAELGEKRVRGFMRRLGYSQADMDAVGYLVRWHMLPSGLPRIPSFAIEGVLANPLFPTLLELYRCDELSTFRGPEGYYEACAAYKAYLKHAKNPYRDTKGTQSNQRRMDRS